MRRILETIQHNYKADGSDENYAIVIDSEEEMNDLFKFNELDKEEFEEKFTVDMKEITYPIITFDTPMNTRGDLFDSKANREEIMSIADDYFSDRNNEKLWVFDDYVVFEDKETLDYSNKFEEVDILRFEKRVLENEGEPSESTLLPKQINDWSNDEFFITEPEGEVLGTVAYDNGIELVHRHLNNGADPIADGWINNKEEALTINGWDNKEKPHSKNIDMEM